MIIGSHVGLKSPDFMEGSVKEALSYNANALMLYTGAPQNTQRKDINELHVDEANELIKKYNIEVIVHAPYILNLASPDEDKRLFSINFLKQELTRVEKMNAKKLVLHPGNHMTNSRKEGLDLIIDSLNKVGKTNVDILLETMAGKGTELCKDFEEIKYIMDRVNYPLYVCFDTCHVYDSGYDIKESYDSVMNNFDKIVGIDKIKCIHLNDTKNPLGSHKDRHENISKGYLGLEFLRKIANDERFINVAKILETPYIDGVAPYKEEIELIKG